MFDYQKAVKQGHQLPVLRYLNVDLYVNRPLGGVIARALFATRVTPNQLTVVSFLFNMLGAAAFCMGRYPFIVAGVILQIAGNVLDSADGMLARSRGTCNDFGAALDLILDRIGDLFLYGSVIVAYYRLTHDPLLAVAALAGLAMFNLQVTLYYLVETYKGVKKTGLSGESRALIGWLIFVCMLLSRPDILMWVIVVEPVANVIYRVVYFLSLRRRPAG